MVLLGRDREQAALRELLDSARRGRGGALVLRGDVGLGLTALLGDAVAAAEDMRVVRVCGAVAERSLPFAAVHQIWAWLRDQFDELPEMQRAALAAAFEPVDGRPPDRFAVGQALLALLHAAVGEESLVCVIDDAQWLDQDSAEIVAFIARRLDRERIAVVGALHAERGAAGLFTGVPELEVGPLPPDVARDVLNAVVSGPLDPGVRERLVDEAAGVPLGLVELPRELAPEQLAGVAGLPAILPAGPRVQERLLAPLCDLPHETRMLLLLAAIETRADANLLWRAVGVLAIPPEAAAPAEAQGVLRLDQRIGFRHPLMRLAIYGAATVAERQAAHEAFVGAIDPVLDPDAHVWHRAAIALVPDEHIARDLESSAARARSRREDLVAVARLERAAELTAEPPRRYGRTLAAAQAALAAGALGRAAALLDTARPRALDELQRATAERLRGMIALARGRSTDRVTMLLGAARAFESLDEHLARDTYLEAIEAAVAAGRFGRGSMLLEIAEAARARPREIGFEPGPADLLLEGLSLLITAGHGVAVAGLRRAINALRDAEDPRWLALGALAALEIWDDEGLHDLASKSELARGSASHGLDWLAGLDDVLAGRLGSTAAPQLDVHVYADAPFDPRGARAVVPAQVLASAWRGRSPEAREVAETCMREAFARDLGLQVSAAHHAVAVLEIGLGRYEAALAAARDACDEPAPLVVTATLPELIEAAVRSGERELAAAAVARLSERAIPAGTHWALGTLTRSRALLAEGADAERLYGDAIEHLRRSRTAPELARAHLLYGEWLRRERRRREAREELRTARDMFVFMGAQAFAERARLELAATGEHAVRRTSRAAEGLLTAQEARIAHLARDGASNAEIAAELFISARTVEYHLHKVFRKLDVSSRTQLARVLPELDRSA